MTKIELLKELSHSTYVMLKPSTVAGIGVFAIRNIPKGCRDMFSKPNHNDVWITVPREDIVSLPAHVQLLIENYCLYDAENYFVPDYGFKKVDVSLFLNHSEKPNIISVQDGDYFETIVDIQEGEELFIDYGQIVADE